MTSTEFDVAAFVRRAREKTVVELLAERQRQADRDFAAFMDRHMEESWEDMKRKLIEDFERQKQGGASQDKVDPRVTLEQSTFGQSVARKRASPAREFEDVELDGQLTQDGRIAWRQKEHSLAQVISNLNESRLMRQPIAICAHMSQIVSSMGADVRIQ